jgi:hypothetical protein
MMCVCVYPCVYPLLSALLNFEIVRFWAYRQVIGFSLHSTVYNLEHVMGLLTSS